MKAFVTDGDERAALAVTRSLGRRGVSVMVGEQQPFCLASSSKYCARQVTYPSPYRQPGAFRRFLQDFVQRERVDVIVPVTDVTTSSISFIEEALRPFAAIAAPPFQAFDHVTDKSTVLRSAARCGIPIPRTHFVDGLSALRRVVERVEYPAVVKPARSRVLTDLGWLGTRVHYAHSEMELRRLYEQTTYLTSYPSLIQQRVVGPGVGLFVLFDHGQLVTSFAHRRLREKPPSGGVSVLCESVPVDPRLRDDAIRLLGPLGWHGVAMLEYKQDGATGDRFLMEVNGRFWGSLQLAVDAGVDFPYLSCELALGRRPDVPQRYRVGVQNRWLLGDLDHLLERLLKREANLCLPDTAPSRLRTLIEWMACTRPGVHDQVISGDDPCPFLYELHQYARRQAAWVAEAARRHVARSCLGRLRFLRPSMPSPAPATSVLHSPEP
jgi:predicted ATP-grasp superfamily ATP-dependent carboligase